MNFKKIALCLCGLSLSTQLFAKDLAGEREMVCLVRAELALGVSSKIKEAGEQMDDIKRFALWSESTNLRVIAEEKYLSKLKVSRETFESAENRIEEQENNMLEKYLTSRNVKISPDNLTVFRKETFKFRMQQLKQLKCYLKAKPMMYEVEN